MIKRFFLYLSGWLNRLHNFVILFIIFFFVITPMGILRQFVQFCKGQVHKIGKFRKSAVSYRVLRGPTDYKATMTTPY